MEGTGRYVLANGIRQYVEESGEGPPLLLLHGGLECAGMLPALSTTLANAFRVIEPERRAHGRTADVPGPITYEVMAADTLALMDALAISRAHLVGYSDGANVSLLIARSAPGRVDRLVLISGNFHADGMSEEFRSSLRAATAGTYEPEFRRAYGRRSPDGPEHWPVVFEKVRRLWLEEPLLPAAALRAITAPTLVVAADRNDVLRSHTVQLADAIPGARLSILPGEAQGLLHEQPLLSVQVIERFLAGRLVGG